MLVPSVRAWGWAGQGVASVDEVADTKRVFDVTVSAASRVPSFELWLDGGGANPGGALSQVARPVVYTAGDVLVAQGDEFEVAAGQAAGRATARFTEAVPGGVELQPGTYRFGLHFGPSTQVARVYGDAAAATGRSAVDTYADGASGAFGAPSATGLPAMALYAPWYVPWDPPVTGASEELLARLPYELAQRALGSAPPRPESARARATWHGTSFDPETGDFAIVQSGGELAGLVGRRVVVTLREGLRTARSVVVFVHSERDLFDADISLARRPWTHLLPDPWRDFFIVDLQEVSV